MKDLRVLVVEDDRSLAEVVTYNLQQAGYEVLNAYDGQDAINQARQKHPDLMILDLMLPVIGGLDVCRHLRSDSATRNIRIIMLTAKSEESDELVGFALGADDYVTKPFSIKVLLERIKALCRREEELHTQQLVHSQGVTVDPTKYRVAIDEQPIQLTRSEFRLLETLAREPGRVFSRSDLIDAALGDDTLVMERTIDVHIRAVRRKMGEHARLIETVRGVGYRFRDPSD